MKKKPDKDLTEQEYEELKGLISNIVNASSTLQHRGMAAALRAGFRYKTPKMEEITLGIDGIKVTPPLSELKPKEINILVEQAESDPVSFEACRIIAVEYVQNPAPIPEELVNFICELLKGERERPIGKKSIGTDPYIKDYRNLLILHTVTYLSQRGLPIHTNGNYKGITACNLVSDMLNDASLKLAKSTIYGIYTAQISKDLTYLNDCWFFPEN